MVNKFHLPTTRTKEPRLEELRSSLISVAGVIGRRIVNQDGQELGTIADLVCRWDRDTNYPPLTGIVAKVAWRKVWISIDNIYQIKPTLVTLGNAKLDLREFKVRPGEVSLNDEVLDHQLIDVNGARVVRASDLYIANLANKTHLVGVDVGFKPLLRRLGPSSLRVKAQPDSVIDWATIQSFGGEDHVGRQLRLSANRQELRRMRPGELADLLEDLGRNERQELLNALTPDLAADAMEEMEPKQLESLLRESSPEEGASYLSKMEPDEAADALRDLDDELRDDLLSLIPKESSMKIKKVLDYDETIAGGIMTTDLLTAKANDSGKVVFDLSLIDLLLAGDDQKLEDLIKPPATVTIHLEASLKEVAESLIESRSSSIVVIDKKDRPAGRIFADDLLDGLIPSERFHFPRLLSS
jgi:CBS domain-containing protein